MTKKLSKKTKEELDEKVIQEKKNNSIISELHIDGKKARYDLAMIRHEIEKCTAEKHKLLELKEEVTSEIEMLKGFDLPQGGFISKLVAMKLPELPVKIPKLSDMVNIPDMREVKKEMFSWSSERQMFRNNDNNEISVFSVPRFRKGQNNFNCWSSERVLSKKNRGERELDKKTAFAPLA